MHGKIAGRKTVILLVSIMTLLACSLLIANQLAAKTDKPETQPATQPAQAEAQPDIKFEDKTFDFGNIQKGDKVTHIFTFKNEGSGTLKIKRVQPTCGCTVPKTFTKEALPGKEGKIELIFNSKNFMGAIKKTIYVFSNDPDEPKIGLILKGTVVADVVVHPQRRLFFGIIKQGESTTRNIMVNQTGSKELKVLKVENNLPFITTKVIPEPKNNRNNYKIEVTVSADAPKGKFNGKLEIHTNIEKQNLIKHEIMGTVKPEVAKP